MTIIVAKFGGTSVANFNAMQHCTEIVKQEKDIRILVLSACSKVTDLLIELAKGKKEADREIILSQIKAIHYSIIDKLQSPHNTKEEVDKLIESITNLSRSAELSTNALLADEIVAHGELISTKIFTQHLTEQGENVIWFDARSLIKTNSDFGKAMLDTVATKNHIELLIELISKPGLKIITQGFIGSDKDGRTTTLGRGGSDYTAAIFSEITKARLLQIWTDVPGIFTTDPRITSDAKRIESISFAEASEMATFGAKILHPSTLLPAVRSNIPVFVGNTFAPHEKGTLITQEANHKPDFRGIAVRRDQTLLTITSLNMLHTSGFLAKIFNILGNYAIALDLITTSETSIAMTIDKIPHTEGFEGNLPTKLIEELSSLGKVKIEENLGLIAIIGNDIYRRPCLNKVFTHVDFPIRSISQGASQNNVCLLINNQFIDQAVIKLHKLLFV